MPKANPQNYFWYHYKASSGNTYPLKFGYGYLMTRDIPHDRSKTKLACQTGCRLYGNNGGCPPYSPEFSKFCDRYPQAYVFYIQLHTEFFPEKIRNGNYYVRWNFVEIIQGNLINKLGRSIKDKLGGFLLSAGHCTGCGQRQGCAFRIEPVCKMPSMRMFSMESTGVLVTKLMELAFDIPLLWIEREKVSKMPEYMLKVAMLLNPIALKTSTWEETFTSTIKLIGLSDA